MALEFESAQDARDAVTADQKKYIASLYDKWAEEIADKAKKYKNAGTSSGPLQAQQLNELKKAIKKAGQQVANEANDAIKQSAAQAAQGVVSTNDSWLKSLGFPTGAVDAAFSSVSKSAVENLVTGQIYKTGWSLSKSIWGDNEDTLKKIYEIVAAGQAENKSVYEVSKDLEQYVKPGAKKSWNLTFKHTDKTDGKQKTYRVYPKKVDYSAQRLARTLSQHAYQQGMIAVSEDNPFIPGFIWHATGSRRCELCEERDGKFFPKDKVPMDHPNGMCIMEPSVDPDMDDKLLAWVHGKDGDFPQIDKFAKKLGYGSAFSDAQQKYLSPYGFTPQNMPKDFDEWSHKVSFDQAEEILHSMGTSWSDPHPYQQLNKYFDENLSSLKGAFKTSVKNAVESIKKEKKVKVASFTWQQDKFLGKYGYSTSNMPKDFDEWLSKLDASDFNYAFSLASKKGMTLDKYYESYIGAIKYKWKAADAVSSAIDATAKNSQQKLNKPSTVFDKDDWFDKIKKQTTQHMLDLEEDAMEAFGEKGKEALKIYTGSSYIEMNSYLRYIKAGKTHEEARALSGITNKQLNAIKEASKALNNWKTTEDLVLRRGTDLGDLAGFMSGDFSQNKSSLRGKTIEELNSMFSGVVGEYAGFTSTSSSWDKGFSGDVEMVIYAPKGTSASSIMSISQYGTAEGETLLNAGTKIRIISIEKSDGHSGSSIRVFAEVLPQA